MHYFTWKLEFLSNISSVDVGTKFQLKLRILIFWLKFAHKMYFWSKREKVNITIEFYIFKLKEKK